jgi:probable F420-dependent oxidoreductase
MDFGIQHGMGDPRWKPEILEPRHVAAFARAVDDAGFAYLSFTDHPSPSSSWINANGEGTADLFTSLAFCAAATDRIGLLTWILVVPYHNPFALAHRVATLDKLSAGRLTLGLGTGYLKSEFFAVGADFANRRDVFDRTIDIMKRALSGDEVTAEGPGFSARGVQVQPPVVQRPHPPMWIHGNGRFGLERAARWGQGWIGLLTTPVSVKTIRTTALPDLETMAQRIDELRVATERAGRSVDDVRIVATSVVHHLDLRTGWNPEEYRDRFGRLETMGVDTIIVNAVGDDPQVSHDSALAFAADFIS